MPADAQRLLSNCEQNAEQSSPQAASHTTRGIPAATHTATQKHYQGSM